MNKQISKLITQAGGHWNHGDFNMPSSVEFQEQDIEKFAELIVLECMSIIKQGEGLGEEDDFDKGFQAGIAMAYNRVRTQMGVEE